MRTIFLRNDDVRGQLDESLVYLTDSILDAGYCISHAVEPANVTPLVAEWLLQKKHDYPNQIEIIQHGFDHKIKTTTIKGEFGGTLSYEEQLSDISKGNDIMSTTFKDNWFKAFSFPYGTYNRATLKALDHIGYPVISTGLRWTRKRRILNAIGQILHVKHLGNKNIVYSGQTTPGHSFLELPIIINNTKLYLQPDGGVQKTKIELLNEWSSIPKHTYSGLLTHHRYNTRHDIDEFVSFMHLLKSQGAIFTTLESIYNEKMDHL